MNIANERVEHIRFGVGIITESEGDRIVVKFQDDVGEKAFQYPEAFEKFLKAENPTVQNDALEELHRKQEQLEIEMEQKRKEFEDAELEKKRELEEAKLEKKKAKKVAAPRVKKEKVK
jgi:hypothetical protein